MIRLTRILNLLASIGEVILIAILIKAALLSLDIFSWTGTAR